MTARYTYFDAGKNGGFKFRVICSCINPDDGAETVADLPYYLGREDSPDAVGIDATLPRHIQEDNARYIVEVLNLLEKEFRAKHPSALKPE